MEAIASTGIGCVRSTPTGAPTTEGIMEALAYGSAVVVVIASPAVQVVRHNWREIVGFIVWAIEVVAR